MIDTKEHGRIVYSSFAGIMEGLPTDYAIFRGFVARYAPELFTNYAKYAGRPFELVITSMDGTRLGVSSARRLPATIEELYALMEGMGQPSGGVATRTVTANVFDLVDDRIPRIEKIHGINRFIYMLKGRGAGKNGRVKTAYDTRWTSAQTWANEAWDMALPERTRIGDVDLRAVWTSSFRKFGSPKIGTGITDDMGGTPIRRHYRLNSTGLFAPVDGGSFEFGQPIICNLWSATSWDFERMPFKAKNILNSLSSLLVYPITGTGAGGSGTALYVSPAGVDDVVVNAYDESRYALETVGTRPNRTPRILHTDCSPHARSHTGVKLAKDEYSSFQSDVNNGSLQPWTVRFRLRDRVTGMVGALSAACVAPFGERWYSPLRFKISR